MLGFLSGSKLLGFLSEIVQELKAEKFPYQQVEEHNKKDSFSLFSALAET